MKLQVAWMVLALFLAACKAPSEEASANQPATPTALISDAATTRPVEEFEAADLAVPDETAPVSFNADLPFGNLVFSVQTHGNGGESLLVVAVASAGQNLGEPLRQTLDSGVDQTFVADLDGDQHAEVLVVTKEGKLVAYSFKDAGFIPPRLPHLTEAQAAGHEGDDRFEVVNGKLVRSFSVDAGSTRRLVYRLGPDAAFAVEAKPGMEAADAGAMP